MIKGGIIYRLIAMVLVVTAITGELCAQSATRSLSETIDHLEQSFGVRVFYQEAWLEGLQFTGSLAESLDTALEQVFKGSPLEYTVYQNRVILFPRKGLITSRASQKYLLEGRLTDFVSERALAGAQVTVEELPLNTVTDNKGHFSLEVPGGRYTIRSQYVGFEDQVEKVLIRSDTLLQISLSDKLLRLEGITITDRALDANVNEVQVGKIELSMIEINQAPSATGEVDIIQGVVALPGITTAGEGSTGFNVRGGSTGQNLVLLDKAVIYNPYHLFGIVSAFDANTINQVTLYKGAIPAEYGGRLSSVLDISAENGNKDAFGVTGAIGVLSSKLKLEGPITKDVSFQVAGRVSPSDWYLNAIEDQDIANSTAFFGDGLAKLHANIGTKDQLAVTGYFSTDKFSFDLGDTYRWKNMAASFRWDHYFNDQWSAALTASYSKFEYQVERRDSLDAFDWNADINTVNFSALVYYNPNDRTSLTFGGSYMDHQLNPGILEPRFPGETEAVNLLEDNGREIGGFINYSRQFSNRFSMQAGVRFTYFDKRGPFEDIEFAEGQPALPSNILGSTIYSENEQVVSYTGIEPRLSFNYRLGEDRSVKFGYHYLTQYLHQVSNTAGPTPVDLWILSNTYLEPTREHQFSGGYFQNFNDNTWETSVEGFYKLATEKTDYADGAEILLNDQLETALVQGEGKAYGAELFVRKNKGKLRGSLAYTWSRSLIKVDSEFPEKTISNGDYYPTNYDRPHVVNLNGSVRLSRRFVMSLGFNYATGRPVSAPNAKFVLDQYGLANFRERNNYRIQDYHRMDLSIIYENNLRYKKWRSKWVLSLYNVYGRENVFSVYFASAGRFPEAYQTTILAVPIPTLRYEFSF